MTSANIYKSERALFNMGVEEALELLDALDRHQAVDRPRVQQYVLRALYEPQIRSGTQEYEVLERQMYRELDRLPQPSPLAARPETVAYLRRVLETIRNPRRGLSPGRVPFDGFSPQAYAELNYLLGPAGRKRLGISGSYPTMVPSRRRTRAILQDEWDAEQAAMGRAWRGDDGLPETPGADPFDDEWDSPPESSDWDMSPVERPGISRRRPGYER